MDKEQALQSFWEGFGLPAYDELTVPDDAVMPYITYETATDSLDRVLSLSASIWYHSTSWKEASRKAAEVAEAIGANGFCEKTIDRGYVWFTKGTPFARRMADPADDSVRRVVLNIQVEFLTAY